LFIIQVFASPENMSSFNLKIDISFFPTQHGTMYCNAMHCNAVVNNHVYIALPPDAQ